MFKPYKNITSRSGRDLHIVRHLTSWKMHKSKLVCSLMLKGSASLKAFYGDFNSTITSRRVVTKDDPHFSASPDVTSFIAFFLCP